MDSNIKVSNLDDQFDTNKPEALHHHSPPECVAALAALSAQSTTGPPFTLQYLAEGNANVIYTLHPRLSLSQDSTFSQPPPAIQHYECAVLRLRKALEFTLPGAEVLSAFRTRIRPLFTPGFEDVLLEQDLVELDPHTVDHVNTMLRAMETDDPTMTNVATQSATRLKPRPPPRRGVYHPSFAEEPYGILMPNLLTLGSSRRSGSQQDVSATTTSIRIPSTPAATRLLEFKPKWLLQSPSAPANAVRCRTCAVNLLRRIKATAQQQQQPTSSGDGEQKVKSKAKATRGARGRGDGGFCPFALLSNDHATLNGALETMGLYGPATELTTRALHDGFIHTVQPVLKHLQSLQARYNEVGLQHFRRPPSTPTSIPIPTPESHLGSEDTTHNSGVGDVEVAMALRDCSVFLVVVGTAVAEEQERDEKRGEAIKGIKLADLDLKTTGGGKLERWARTEEELIERGMYTSVQAEGRIQGEGDGAGVEDLGGVRCVWRDVVG